MGTSSWRTVHLTKGYDGVHFRTKEGKKAYSDSLIRILKREKVGSVEEEEENCQEEEWEVARGRRTARRQEAHGSWASVVTGNRYANLN